MRDAGGFDLILGNPPWLKVEWEEKGILGEADPKIAIRKMSASDLAKRRAALFEEWPDMQGAWLDEFCEQAGMQAFLNAGQNYPCSRACRPICTSAFCRRRGCSSNAQGCAGFLHPEGIYDDPKGGVFRAAVYPRLRGHYQFVNEMKLFAEVHDHGYTFSINIYGPSSETNHAFITSPTFSSRKRSMPASITTATGRARDQGRGTRMGEQIQLEHSTATVIGSFEVEHRRTGTVRPTLRRAGHAAATGTPTGAARPPVDLGAGEVRRPASAAG